MAMPCTDTIDGPREVGRLRERTPWTSLEAVELATLERVVRFNRHRLLEPIGHVPPAGYGANYDRQLANGATTVA